MEACPKRSCLSIRNEHKNEDRLSELPDSLLHHILSLLDDTKLVFMTSILSTRWKHVWTNIPNLHFSFKSSNYDLSTNYTQESPPWTPSSPCCSHEYYPVTSPAYPSNDTSPVSPPQSPYYPCTYPAHTTMSSQVQSPDYPCTHPAHTAMPQPPSPNYSPTSPTYTTMSPRSPGYPPTPTTYSPTSPSYTANNTPTYEMATPGHYDPSGSPPRSPDEPFGSPCSTPYSPTTFYPSYSARRSLLAEKVFSFKTFVSTVLNQQKGFAIKKFAFECDVGLELSFVNFVLSHALDHKAQEIVLNAKIDTSKRTELTDCLYASDSLEKLELSIPSLSLSKTMGFATLKELKLDGLVMFISRDIICHEFFSRCPSLENLSFTNCNLRNLELRISAPRLNKLEFLHSLFGDVVVSSPTLAYFIFEGSYPLHLFIDDNCSSLEEVEIDVQTNNAEKAIVINNLLNMLRALQNAKSVTMSLNTLKILSSADPGLLENEPPFFSNLQELKLRTDWSVSEAGLNFLLKGSASNVETSLQLPFLR